MKVLVIFLVFLLSVIVCGQDDDQEQTGYGAYGPSIYDPSSSSGVMTPIDQSGYMPSGPQQLGMNSLFQDTFPASSVTPFGTTNQSVYLAHVCSKNSKISQIIVNSTSAGPVTCNGLVSLIVPRNLSVLIDGKLCIFNISKLYVRRGCLNGNMIEIASGMILDPILCKGDIYFRVTIWLCNSQYQCVTTGLEGQKAIYSLTIINGNCGSYCWLQQGVTTFNPRINILGVVPATPTPSSTYSRNSEQPNN